MRHSGGFQIRTAVLLGMLGLASSACSCQEESTKVAALAAQDLSSAQGPTAKEAVDPGAEDDTEGSPTGESEDEPLPSTVPQVDLSGKNRNLAVTTVEEGPRVYSRHLRAWIHEKPDPDSRRLGYLRAGASSPTQQAPAGKRGCSGGWFQVQPKGYVCVGKRATLDASDPTVQLFEPHPPRFDQLLPYRYGTIRKPGPIFSHLPQLDELPEAEPDFEKRFPLWLTAEGEIGAEFRQDVWEWGKTPIPAKEAWEKRLSRGVPPLMKLDKVLPSPTLTPRPATLLLDRMASRVGHSFLDTFFSEGRRYGLTTHLEVVPTDRYRPISGSDFQGVEIGKDAKIPFAFVRRVGASYSDGSPASYRDVLSLTGKRKFINARLHYETAAGKYISDQYASEVTLAKNMPGWAKKGEKWMSVSINKQVLVLYEGTKAVYATLVSTGEAGLDSADETTATKRGIFRVHTKHVTSTMASNDVGEEFELRDVPYVQYFAEGGFALHGAYWHDRFGTPKSHGCVNLAPEDARRIFFWTDPPVPPGWHGALSPLRGTVVFIHP